MQKTNLNPEKFSISGYMNTTHVGLNKVKFNPYLVKAIDEKLTHIYNNYKGNFYANKVGFPWSVFPALQSSLRNFNAKIGNETFMILYYNHNPIGIIDMDIPRVLNICNKCNKEYKIIPSERTDIPVLNKVQKFFKKYLFHEAWEPCIVPTSSIQTCACGSHLFRTILI
jgi:hypothetical protein